MTAHQCPRIGFTPGFRVENFVRKSAKKVQNSIRKSALKSGNPLKSRKRVGKSSQTYKKSGTFNPKISTEAVKSGKTH